MILVGADLSIAWLETEKECNSKESFQPDELV
jgi:hypothetical protein